MAAKTKAQKTTATKNTKASKTEAAKQTPKPAAAKAEKDKWGNGVKTGCAKINAVIGNKPKTVAQLIEESGQKAVLVRNHVQTLLKKGHIVRTDDGVKAK